MATIAKWRTSPFGDFPLTKTGAGASLRRMEVQLSPEVEAEITRRAASTGKPPAQVVEEIIATALADEAQYMAEVRLGIEQADRGEFIEHEQVMGRIEQRFRS